MNEKEILKRLSEIKAETSNPEANVKELVAEARRLQEELANLRSEAEARKTLEGMVIEEGTIKRRFGEESNEPQTAERKFDPETAEYRNAYMKNLQGKDLTVEERTAIDAAGAVIPTQTMNEIIGRLQENPVLAAIDITNFAGYVSFPVENACNEANWVDMGVEATDGADSIEEVRLGAYKLIKTIEIEADVKALSIPAFEQWIVARLVNKLQVALAAAAVNGDGTGKATGIFHAGAVTKANGTWTQKGMTFKDLMLILAALPSEYAPNASFVTNADVFFGQLFGMTDSTGKPIVIADPQAKGQFLIMGYPVILDSHVPADSLAFGDMKTYKMNLSKDIEISADASVGFRKGSTVYRGMCLADGKPADKNAIVIFKKGMGA